MIDTEERHRIEAIIFDRPTQPLEREVNSSDPVIHKSANFIASFKQVLRFGVVGGLNTLVDLLVLNGLLWLFHTNSTPMLLTFSAVAYSFGAINSFLLNKYWTFRHWQKTTRKELARFALTTLCGIAWSTAILWLASNALRSVLGNSTLWANASKIVAIAGTTLISYLGMRLWVFVSTAQKQVVH